MQTRCAFPARTGEKNSIRASGCHLLPSARQQEFRNNPDHLRRKGFRQCGFPFRLRKRQFKVITVCSGKFLQLADFFFRVKHNHLHLSGLENTISPEDYHRITAVFPFCKKNHPIWMVKENRLEKTDRFKKSSEQVSRGPAQHPPGRQLQFRRHSSATPEPLPAKPQSSPACYGKRGRADKLNSIR